MSDITKKCMSTWHNILSDYEFILWDSNKFDVNSISFVKQAYDNGKWAIAADYIRLYAIYTEGGIYLDTDVYIQKSFNDLLSYDFFTSLERDLTTVPPDSNYAKLFMQNENKYFINNKIERYEGFGLQAAIFGAKANNLFIKDCMNWYENNNFLLPDGKNILSTKLIAPDIYAAIAQKYGFKYISGFQQLKNNMVIFPADYFPNHLYKTDNAYAIHFCENSWTKNKKYYVFNRLKNYLKRNNIIRYFFGKKKYYRWEKVIKLGGEYYCQKL